MSEVDRGWKPRYPHWLSGEYTQAKTWGRSHHQWTLARAGEGFLKLHALFGMDLAVSDVHMFDSPALLMAFEDGQFQKFLRETPEFLSLVAEPAAGSWSQPRHARCARALERCLQEGWTSGALDSPKPKQALARVLMDEALKQDSLERALQAPAVNEVLAKCPRQEKQHLRNVMSSLKHFALASGVPVREPDPSVTRESLYTILQRALGHPELGEAEQIYRPTVDFIEDPRTIDDPDNRHRQAVVFTALDEALHARRLDTASHRMIRNTTHHAWQAAVQRTVAHHAGGSIGNLPDSVPVYQYLGEEQASDVVIPLSDPNEPGFKSPRFEAKPLFTAPWNPMQLSWGDVLKAVDTAKEEREAYQRARESGSDDVADTLEEFLGKLGEHFSSSMRQPVHPWLWRLGPAATGAALAVWFGPLGAVAGPVLVEVVHQKLLEQCRYKIVDTLSSAERQL